MDTQELVHTALRAVGVYVFILLVIRLLGKRAVGNFGAFDLLVALMLGEIVDEIIYGDVSWSQGAVAILVIALIEYGSEWLSYLSPRFHKLLSGDATVLIADGRWARAGLRRERMGEDEVLTQLRHQGIDDVSLVRCARLETDGRISVIKRDES